MSEKGRRHNNRRGKLPSSRENWKTLTIGEHRGSVPYREICVKSSTCLSCGAEILFPRVYRVINYSTDWFERGKKTIVVRKALIFVFPGSRAFCCRHPVSLWSPCVYSCVQLQAKISSIYAPQLTADSKHEKRGACKGTLTLNGSRN